MGCTNSKENTNPPSTTITDHNQQLINEHFRQWLKSNRPKADEYVLNHILSTTKQSTNIDDYRPIVSKALDLLSDRSDIKSINKLTKLVQKEVSLASPKKVSHTIDILKQTAEKLRHEQIIFDDNSQQTTNGEIPPNPSATKHSHISSGEVGSALKEALENARILFYKGKQAAIFANPNGGYDVRIIDENDDVLKQDGNLLRSIIVTEVKMRPKPTITTSPQFTAPPPPPPRVLDEREIGDDFRRSIDAALKGLEAIYQTTPVNPTDHIPEKKGMRNAHEYSISRTDIQPKLVGAVDDMNEIMLDTIETTSGSEIGNTIPLKEEKEQKENLPTHQSSPLQNDDSSFPQEKATLSNKPHPQSFNIPSENLAKNGSNSNNPNSNNQTSHNPSTLTNKIPEEHHKPLSESSLTPVIMPIDTNTSIKSPSHNVTYTEIIHSESHDGEQSRRFITESYDELPTKDDEQTTTLKVVTKSEFSNHPLLREKIMEQTVQILTVKVRNETVTTTRPSDHEISPTDVNPIDTII